ncbi:MAG: DNA repair protein RadC, partial [Planctomycetota bacterium]|nr:DNA repair protein RadC [Planctomycetota bacterium]
GAGKAGREPAPTAARAPGAAREPGPSGRQASSEAAFRAFIQAVARATGEDPLAITLMLRVFSSGIYGLVAEPLCGEIPRCDRCPFSASCRFVLTRGRGLLPDGRATSAALLTGNPRDIADGDLIAFLLDGRDADSRSTAMVESFLKRVGSFHALVSEALAGRRPDLAGLDADRAARLACAVEIVRRYAEGPRRSGKAFRSAADFYEHFRLRLRDRKQEVFCVAMLDQKLRLIDDQEISAGTLTTTVVHPREVFAPAIQRRAASVALIHNHPSGDPTPSGEDRAITRRLLEAAEITGIGLLDHVIVGDGCFFSFVEKQLL